MKLEQMKPHYLNDFLIENFKEQGKRANWNVSTNPYEGGSDHVPFLHANIPSVLFWHFTDQFYHTDNDRIDKVSKTTLKNVGITSLISAYSLLNSDENTAKVIINKIENAALSRLNEEFRQGEIALKKGDALKTQIAIISAWEDWYVKATETTSDMVHDLSLIKPEIEKTQTLIKITAKKLIDNFSKQ